eukprot:scaffold23370_cov120-Isochrysis_galbana.AAC.5
MLRAGYNRHQHLRLGGAPSRSDTHNNTSHQEQRLSNADSTNSGGRCTRLLQHRRRQHAAAIELQPGAAHPPVYLGRSWVTPSWQSSIL